MNNPCPNCQSTASFSYHCPVSGPVTKTCDNCGESWKVSSSSDGKDAKSWYSESGSPPPDPPKKISGFTEAQLKSIADDGVIGYLTGILRGIRILVSDEVREVIDHALTRAKENRYTGDKE